MEERTKEFEKFYNRKQRFEETLDRVKKNIISNIFDMIKFYQIKSLNVREYVDSLGATEYGFCDSDDNGNGVCLTIDNLYIDDDGKLVMEMVDECFDEFDTWYLSPKTEECYWRSLDDVLSVHGVIFDICEMIEDGYVVIEKDLTLADLIDEDYDTDE